MQKTLYTMPFVKPRFKEKRKMKIKYGACLLLATLALFIRSLAAGEQKPSDDSVYWGYHLILDCKACDKDKITNGDNIKKFVKVLVQRIGMKAYGEPILEHFATHNPTVGGYSLLQLIETSDITAHFVDINGDAYIDIFSCKRYDISIAESVVREYFNPKSVKKTYIERQA